MKLPRRRKPTPKPPPTETGLALLASMRDQVLLGLIPVEEYEAKKRELYGRV